MNTSIYIAPVRQESSEALAAEEITFEFFLQMSRWTELKSSVRREGCSMSPDAASGVT